MVQKCSRALCDQGVGTAAAIQQPPQQQLRLELDSESSLVSLSHEPPREAPGSTMPSTDGQVFFRPVDGNLAHQTFLGDGFRSDFECMGQILSIVRTERDTANRIREVFLGPTTGEPKAMTLSKQSFERLSSSLKIWECGETGYHVQRSMYLD